MILAPTPPRGRSSEGEAGKRGRLSPRRRAATPGGSAERPAGRGGARPVLGAGPGCPPVRPGRFHMLASRVSQLLPPLRSCVLTVTPFFFFFVRKSSPRLDFFLRSAETRLKFALKNRQFGCWRRKRCLHPCGFAWSGADFLPSSNFTPNLLSHRYPLLLQLLKIPLYVCLCFSFFVCFVFLIQENEFQIKTVESMLPHYSMVIQIKSSGPFTSRCQKINSDFSVTLKVIVRYFEPFQSIVILLGRKVASKTNYLLLQGKGILI